MDTRFSNVDGLDGVYVAQSGKLSCTAFRLRGGGLCLYSPIAGLEKSQFEQLNELGGISALLAPNHYHNKGLEGHLNAFPNTSLYCSALARPRLQKVTGLTFQTLDILKADLPQGHRILEPEGLKTGEIWIQVETSSERAWIVTDAFSAPLDPSGNHGDRAEMLGTFPRYGIKDAAKFQRWVNEQISRGAPTMPLPCHGSPVRASDLGFQLKNLLENLL